jgi:hypothetical protein
MRLLTHNMLASNVKASCTRRGVHAWLSVPCQTFLTLFCLLPQGVQNGFPLRIEVEKLETREVEFSAGARVLALRWTVHPGFGTLTAMVTCRLSAAHLPEARVESPSGGSGA